MEYAYSEFLVITPHYWGRGPTPEQAALQLRKSGGRLTQQQWYRVVPGTVCEELNGNILHPKGLPPQRIPRPKLAKGWQTWPAE